MVPGVCSRRPASQREGWCDVHCIAAHHMSSLRVLLDMPLLRSVQAAEVQLSLSLLSQTPPRALRDSNSHFIFDLELERGPVSGRSEGKVTFTTNPEAHSCACVQCLNCLHPKRVICFANSQAVRLDVDSRIGCIGKPVTCDTRPSFGANSLLIAEQHAGNESKFINDGICLYVTAVV